MAEKQGAHREHQEMERMRSIWDFLRSAKNRAILSWIGGGVVVVVGGIWAVVTFFWPDHAPGPSSTTVCAENGAVAAGGNASGNTITITNSGSAGSQACPDAGKK